MLIDGFIAITDKKVVKFVVNTGTGKITLQRQNGKNKRMIGSVTQMFLACWLFCLESI